MHGPVNVRPSDTLCFSIFLQIISLFPLQVISLYIVEHFTIQHAWNNYTYLLHKDSY